MSFGRHNNEEENRNLEDQLDDFNEPPFAESPYELVYVNDPPSGDIFNDVSSSEFSPEFSLSNDAANGFDPSSDIISLSDFDLPLPNVLFPERSGSVSPPSEPADSAMGIVNLQLNFESLSLGTNIVDSAQLDSISYPIESNIFDTPHPWGDLTVPAVSEETSDETKDVTTEGLEESSVDDQKYPLDLCLPFSNQADASDSSSDNSSDSFSDILIGNISRPVSKCSKKTRKAKRVWSKSENEKLLMICREVDVERNHRCWNMVAKKMATNRTAKQCREHYVHLTSTNKKSTWSEDEDQVLWSFICGEISEEEMSRRLHRSQKQINERRAILERNCRQWSIEEDEIIQRLDAEGKGARFITKELLRFGFKRTNQQVKDRLAYLKSIHP